MTEDVIRVNMSDKEAQSKDREPLPKGKFHYKFTDMEVMAVKETAADGSPNKNAGKPYIAFTLTVQEGKYTGRNDWVNMMCFEGALYTAAQILQALGIDFPIGPDGKAKGSEISIPAKPDFYIGKDIIGRRDISRKNGQPLVDPATGEPRIQLQGFSAYTGKDGLTEFSAKSTSNSATGAKTPSGVLP